MFAFHAYALHPSRAFCKYGSDPQHPTSRAGVRVLDPGMFMQWGDERATAQLDDALQMLVEDQGLLEVSGPELDECFHEPVVNDHFIQQMMSFPRLSIGKS
jgi:hypothetical protein